MKKDNKGKKINFTLLSIFIFLFLISLTSAWNFQSNGGSVILNNNVTINSNISWSQVTNGTMLSYAQALNNTLMQQANWNATNTSYFDLNKANTAGAFNQTFDTSTLFIDSVSNRVGIGTTSPLTMIHGKRAITGASNISYALMRLTIIHDGDMGDGFGGGYYMGIQDNAGVENLIAMVGAIRDGADNSGKLGFYVANAGTIGYAKLTVDKLGNVGIGTTVPQNKLDVNGSINQSGTGNLTGNMIYGGSWNKTTGGFETVNLVTTQVYVPITKLRTDMNNGVTITNGTGNMTIQMQGTYQVTVGASIGQGQVSEYGMKLYLNEVGQDKCYSHFETSAAIGGTPFFTCFLNLVAGDVINVRMDDHTNPVNDPTISNLNFNILRVGN